MPTLLTSVAFVLLFILALVIEYLVVPELVGASKDLYLLGQVNAVWLDEFAGVIWAAGYQTFIYGSLATVLGNPPKEGYLVADWNRVPAIPPYANVIGCQYQANIPWEGTEVDLSVITDTMLAHGGIGPRH